MSFTNIPPIRIGNLEVGLFQGGMGVKISGANLASAVANEGGAGIIASVGLGLFGYFAEEIKKIHRKGFEKFSSEEKREKYAQAYILANQAELRTEIREARKKSNGVIGVNIMHALSDYSSLVKTAIEENVDIIISGAGIPRELPKYLNGKNTKLIPIVSSARLAEMICKSWSRLNYLPDAIIVEGPMAGGHLGYSKAELDDPEFTANGLEKIILEVISAIKPYESSSKKIPVIAAGGIFYGGDVRKFIELGASGVQMATRFVTTHECDAELRFKQEYIKCGKENIRIIDSPVGMPGRAIINDFLNKVEAGNKMIPSWPYHCLKTCVPEKSPYCIAKALINAQRGEFSNGFAFAGANAWRCHEIVSVKQVMEDLDKEYVARKTQ